ncbi:toxin-antitoxin system, antitoxin component, Xre domain protein [Lachnoanaerobaculum saburreum F0468]|uniref:Toxin-antitoxin system, antitoxin component, Xre domain protein n=2 Tax=Lachnoanaerobaculum saburreum TaxID=467210 RepID=I0RAC1_9FIRM|nr:toxin-antitoxin system, antitoxin component, Xre domain protein [Lachnoanaerobaculum saburreum F0468]
MPDDFDLDKVNTLMDYFGMLNDLGQDKAIERVEELTEIKKYTEPDDK